MAQATENKQPQNTVTYSNGSEILAPEQLPDAEALYNTATQSWSVSNELFNSYSGFYTVFAQKQISLNNPPCPTCAPDLNFQPINSDPAPLPGQPQDEYGRISWHTLEPKIGEYDFSVINNVLTPCPTSAGALCLPKGIRFGFRIMAFMPQVKVSTNIKAGTDGYPVYSEVPDYIEKDAHNKSHGWLLPVNPTDITQGHYFVPDWNDPYVLDRIWALLSALGAQYDMDPRIGVIDIGLYGSWGEWHTYGLPDVADYKYGAIPYTSDSPYFSINTQAYQTNTGVPGAYQPGTATSKDAIVWAHIRAFPHKQLVMLTADSDALCTALHADVPIPVGLRRDSLGSYTVFSSFPALSGSCGTPNDLKQFTERWKKAPFLVEPFGNGSSPTFPCQTFETDPTTNALAIDEQISQYHIAALKNGAYCAGSWAQLTTQQQAAVWIAGLAAGYRYAPKEIWIPVFAPNSSPILNVHTQWINKGVAPTYDPWTVEFSLWTHPSDPTVQPQQVAAYHSSVDLREVVPKTSNYLVHDDSFALPATIQPGFYALEMRVIDASGYLNPMQLALKNQTSDGHYMLGLIQIPKFVPATTTREAIHSGK